MTILPVPRVIALDCDGVLLDTVRGKLEALRRWVPERYAGRREEFVDYCRLAFGTSRHALITHFYARIAMEQLAAAELQAEVERFGVLCAECCSKIDWVPGAEAFLRSAHAAGLPLYVVSGAPQAELEKLFHERHAQHLFRRIYGHPARKPEVLRELLAQWGGRPAELWMIGDSTMDAKAAHAVGATFIHHPSELPFEEQFNLRVSNLTELEAFLCT